MTNKLKRGRKRLTTPRKRNIGISLSLEAWTRLRAIADARDDKSASAWVEETIMRLDTTREPLSTPSKEILEYVLKELKKPKADRP